MVTVHTTDGIYCNMQRAICMDTSYELLEGKMYITHSCIHTHTHTHFVVDS